MIGDMIQRLEDAELRIAQLQKQVRGLGEQLKALRKSQTTKSHSETGLEPVIDDADWERLAYSDKEKARLGICQ